MGNDQSSHTNLSHDSNYFVAGNNSTIACWGDSAGVFLRNHKVDDHTEVWDAIYKIGKRLEHCCCFSLQATHDDNGVQRIQFRLMDSADNETAFCLDISKVRRFGLRGGITSIGSSVAHKCFTHTEDEYTIETVLLSYDCCYRDGLFVLQTKRMNYSDKTYMVTMAHYYVTKDVGLYAEAKIGRSKYGKGCDLELKGPFKYPSATLRKVMGEIYRTGGLQSLGANSSTETRYSNSSPRSDDRGQIVSPANVYQQFNVYSGDSNWYDASNNYDGRRLDNSGIFNGHGNADYINGDFDASTSNYNYHSPYNHH